MLFDGIFDESWCVFRRAVIIEELGISADFQFEVNELRPTHAPEKAHGRQLASSETRTLKRAKFKKELRHGGRTNCTGIRYELDHGNWCRRAEGPEDNQDKND